jgi:thiamine-phosphate pyrophosphorylase
LKLCLVTDRRRLCGEAASFADARQCLAEQARVAVEAGVDLIQVRERDLEAGQLAAIVQDIVRLTRGSATRVVVNDRVDVALAAGADGVHLRAASLPTDLVRYLTPELFLVGRSVHRADEVAAAGRVDYLIAGTVFATSSKDQATPLLGVDGLAQIVKLARVPVLAIGGVTVDRAEQIAATGAAGLAAIALFINAPRLDELRRRFDSVRTAP